MGSRSSAYPQRPKAPLPLTAGTHRFLVVSAFSLVGASFFSVPDTSTISVRTGSSSSRGLSLTRKSGMYSWLRPCIVYGTVNPRRSFFT